MAATDELSDPGRLDDLAPAQEAVLATAGRASKAGGNISVVMPERWAKTDTFTRVTETVGSPTIQKPGSTLT